MAGSLNHLIDGDGSLTLDTIENLRDAGEALEECFDIIGVLCAGDMDRLASVCHGLHYPVPDAVPKPLARKATP